MAFSETYVTVDAGIKSTFQIYSIDLSRKPHEIVLEARHETFILKLKYA